MTNFRIPKKPEGLTVPVTPKEIVETTKRGVLTATCTNVHISVRVKLKEKATVQVGLYTAEDNLIKVAIIQLASEAYDAWGEDDGYVVNKVLEALEMTAITQ